MKKLVVSMFALSLAACVSYKPIPEGYQGPLVLVKDSSNSISPTKVQFFQLSKVDGRPVETSAGKTGERNYGRGMAMDVVMAQRQIPAGESTLSIQGVTHVAAPILALGGGMYSVQGDVTAVLEEGKVYTVKGALSDESSAVWLEDSEGNIVSDKVEKKGT